MDLPDGHEQLEAKQLEAFGEYQAETTRLYNLTVAATEEETANLENLKMIYEATKKVKEDLIDEEVSAQLAEAKAVNGLDGLQEVADAAADMQFALAKKAQEFYGDEETDLKLTAAETTMHAIQKELTRVANSDEVSVRETETILTLAAAAKEKESYNRIYADVLPLMRGGNEMQFEMYFEALEEQFLTIEADLNTAVVFEGTENHNDDLPALQAEFDKALIDKKAALDVQFDVPEAVNAEELMPEVTLTVDEESDLQAPIDTFRETDGGDRDIYELMKTLFDDVLDYEN
jgi:hypothetical protein